MTGKHFGSMHTLNTPDIQCKLPSLIYQNKCFAGWTPLTFSSHTLLLNNKNTFQKKKGTPLTVLHHGRDARLPRGPVIVFCYSHKERIIMISFTFLNQVYCCALCVRLVCKKSYGQYLCGLKPHNFCIHAAKSENQKILSPQIHLCLEFKTCLETELTVRLKQFIDSHLLHSIKISLGQSKTIY